MAEGNRRARQQVVVNMFKAGIGTVNWLAAAF